MEVPAVDLYASQPFEQKHKAPTYPPVSLFNNNLPMAYTSTSLRSFVFIPNLLLHSSLHPAEKFAKVNFGLLRLPVELHNFYHHNLLGIFLLHQALVQNIILFFYGRKQNCFTVRSLIELWCLLRPITLWKSGKQTIPIPEGAWPGLWVSRGSSTTSNTSIVTAANVDPLLVWCLGF